MTSILDWHRAFAVHPDIEVVGFQVRDSGAMFGSVLI